MTVYSRNTSFGKSIFELVLQPLVEKQTVPNVVDVGARNGMFLLPDAYTSKSSLYGFEPNKDEYEKLTNSTTDMHRHLMEQNYKMPKFANEFFYNCAIWDSDCNREFFVTKGTGACTMMGKTLPYLEKTFYLYPQGDSRRNISLAKLHTDVVSTEKVECRALDNILDEKLIIDFLKIDVEGAEIKVLNGAEKLFNNKQILFVQNEFQCFPYYENHSVFGEQHVFLNDKKMRLIDLNLNHPKYRRGSIDFSDKSGLTPIFAGDAFFILDPDRNKLEPLILHRIALLLLIFGYNSLAFSCLEDANLLTIKELDSIASAIKSKPDLTRNQLILNCWNQIPYKVYKYFSSVKNIFR